MEEEQNFFFSNNFISLLLATALLTQVEKCAREREKKEFDKLRQDKHS